MLHDAGVRPRRRPEPPAVAGDATEWTISVVSRRCRRWRGARSPAGRRRARRPRPRTGRRCRRSASATECRRQRARDPASARLGDRGDADDLRTSPTGWCWPIATTSSPSVAIAVRVTPEPSARAGNGRGPRGPRRSRRTPGPARRPRRRSAGSSASIIRTVAPGTAGAAPVEDHQRRLHHRQRHHGEQRGCDLVHPLERLGHAQLALARAHRLDLVGGERRARARAAAARSRATRRCSRTA